MPKHSASEVPLVRHILQGCIPRTAFRDGWHLPQRIHGTVKLGWCEEKAFTKRLTREPQGMIQEPGLGSPRPLKGFRRKRLPKTGRRKNLCNPAALKGATTSAGGHSLWGRGRETVPPPIIPSSPAGVRVHQRFLYRSGSWGRERDGDRQRVDPEGQLEKSGTNRTQAILPSSPQ